MNSRRFCRVSISLAMCAAALAAQGCVRISDADEDPDETAAAVRSVIEAQQAAWNRGDVEAFMDGYERAETTLFVSGDTVTRGWETVLERYRKSYDTREKMGTLAFSELEIRPLSPFYVQVTGRWQLQRAGDAPRGRFTLLFRRTAQGWKIVYDHTSSA